MSEAGGTESSGFTPDQADAITQAQIASQGAGVATGPPVTPADLGAQAVAAGAAPSEVDVNELLAELRRTQARIDALEAEKRSSQVPAVVNYATAFADHLQARADANPVIHGDPDHTYMPALERAASLVNAAGENADLAGHVAFLRRWLDRHGRRFPSHDVDYLRELLDETEDAAAKAA